MRSPIPVGRDQQLGQDRADEACGEAEPQPGEDHRARRRQHDLDDDLPREPRKELPHLDQRDRRVAHGLEEFSTITGIAMMQTTSDLGGEADAVGEDQQRDQRRQRRRLRDDEERRRRAIRRAGSSP